MDVCNAVSLNVVLHVNVSGLGIFVKLTRLLKLTALLNILLTARFLTLSEKWMVMG